jgi:hypothetical protein
VEITPIGWILLLVAIYFFFFKPDLLYWCMVFALPFSATAIINVDFAGSKSGIQAAIVFGSLWILKDGSTRLKKSDSWRSEHMRASVRRLWFFMFAVALSLAMPLWINGKLVVECPDLGCTDSGPLSFSARHITQTIYLAYGVIITIFIALRNSDLREFRKTIRVFLAASIFVSFWGFLQWYCYRAGISYPSFIFNNNASESAMGYLQDLPDLGLTRVSSVATEPSMLSQYMLVAAVFAIFAVFGRRIVISRLWDRLALGAAVLVLLLSTSSTAYAGLAILVPVSMFGLWYLKKLGLRPLAIVGIAMAILYVVYVSSPLMQDVADSMIFSKSEGYSAIGRFNSLVLALGYFRAFPILGIGWGSAASYDVALKLLSNTGILGLLTFGLFIKTIFTGLWRSMAWNAPQKRLSEQAYWACCLLVASFMLIVTNEISGFAFVYGHPWFVFGMALAVPDVVNPSLGSRRQELLTPTS